MTMKRVGIGQEWISRDKRVAREAAADASVGREAVQEQAAIGEARLQTALAYLDAFYAGESLKLATLNEHHADDEFEAARGRLASATASSQEVLALAGARGMAGGRIGRGRPAARLGPGGTRALDRRPRRCASAAAATGRADRAGLHRRASGGGGVAARHRRRAPGGHGRCQQPHAELELGGVLRSAHGLFRHGLVRRQHPDPGRARGAPGPRDRLASSPSSTRSKPISPKRRRSAGAEYQILTSDARRLQERIERYRAAVVAAGRATHIGGDRGVPFQPDAPGRAVRGRHAEVEAQRKLLSLQRDLAKAQAQLAFRPLAGSAS